MLTFRKSNMILAFHSDAGYLNEPIACTQAASPLPQWSLPTKQWCHPQCLSNYQKSNVVCGRSELGALYINAHEIDCVGLILECLDHKLMTPLQKASLTAVYNLNKQKPWIESGTMKHLTNSEFIGDKDTWVLLTIGQHITQQHTIITFVQKSQCLPAHCWP